MPISTKCLIEQVNACLDTNPSELNLAQIAGVKAANTIYSVPAITDLPSAELNKGRMIFVEDISAYRYSDGFVWSNDYDSISRVDSKMIFTWGVASEGVLGIDDNTTNRSSPVREFSSSTNWCFLSSGFAHTLAIKEDGTMWGWGCARSGVIGDGSTGVGSRALTPRQERCSDTTWCYVSAGGIATQNYGGSAHSNAVKTNGTLWSFGNGLGGQLGRNNTSTSGSPVQEISLSTNWCISSASDCFSAGIKTDGTLWVWGTNGYGLLGNNCATGNMSSPIQEITSSNNWAFVQAGGRTSIALKTNGELWGWGCNNSGQIGTGNTLRYSSPVQESTSSTDWNFISIRDNRNSLGIKSNGTLWVWGCGSDGQLGRNTVITSTFPVQEFTSSTTWCYGVVSINSSSAIKTDNTLWLWGGNQSGQLLTIDVVNRSSPTQEFSSSSDWRFISAGSCFGVGLRFVRKGFDGP